jgi:hypothetical protein
MEKTWEKKELPSALESARTEPRELSFEEMNEVGGAGILEWLKEQASYGWATMQRNISNNTPSRGMMQ